jgi:hypothetical protein
MKVLFFWWLLYSPFLNADHSLAEELEPEGVSRVQADARAADRIAAAAADADVATSATAPTLESWLVIPAQHAPRTSAEVLATAGDVHLQASARLDAARGSTVVQTGDAVKGSIDTVFMDPLLVHAPQGKIVLEAPQGTLDRAYPQAALGVEQSPGIVQHDTPEVHHAWDHTEELRHQQEATAMRHSMMMPGGGMGMFPETAAVSFNMGGGGTSVTGFTPAVTGHSSHVDNLHKRPSTRRWEEGRARGRAPVGAIDQLFAQMGGPNIRAHIVPNGIIERMEMHAFHMQQEHAWNQFEREWEESLTQSYESTDGATSTATEVTAEDRAVLKTITNTAKALEKAVIRKATSKEDRPSLIDGLWDAESYRTKQTLEATIRDVRVSEKLRIGAQIALELATEGMQALWGGSKS